MSSRGNVVGTMAPTHDEAALRSTLDTLLKTMTDQQERRVLALGRRLKPGVTDEDLRNAHDFAELDTDFHYEDGILAGLLQASAAIRALWRDRDAAAGANET